MGREEQGGEILAFLEKATANGTGGTPGAASAH